MIELHSFPKYRWCYPGFLRFAPFPLTINPDLSQRQAQGASTGKAAAWSVIWAGLMLLFKVLRFHRRRHAARGIGTTLQNYCSS